MSAARTTAVEDMTAALDGMDDWDGDQTYDHSRILVTERDIRHDDHDSIGDTVVAFQAVLDTHRIYEGLSERLVTEGWYVQDPEVQG